MVLNFQTKFDTEFRRMGHKNTTFKRRVLSEQFSKDFYCRTVKN